MTAALFEQLQASLGRDLVGFMPELVLCGTIVLLLLIRLFSRFDSKHLGWVAFILTLYALLVSWQQWSPAGDAYTPTAGGQRAFEMFGGLLVYDNFTVFLRLFLLGFAALVILLTLMTGIPDHEDSADFYCLLLGATVGMSIMASANHLLMVFLGVEMASLPCYALAGFLKGRRQSSEAALKYVVYGGGASGIMLYGISLLAGKYGTAYMPDLLLFVGRAPLDAVAMLGILFLLIGIAFKLSAVPFHFWCPDVFEGAAAEVGAFLSVASKGAALALLGRIVFGLGGLATTQADYAAWNNVTPYLVPILAFLAIITMTFGNLAAYLQTNLKRLLAYSTIAHAGFMIMGLATLTPEGGGAVLFYLIAYLFMNLGAFAVVAFLRNLTGSEDMRDFRGLIYRSPVLVITLAFFLLSLLGMPPLAGFAAKLQVFLALYYAGQQYVLLDHPHLAVVMFSLIVIGGLNSVLSLFYYVNVLKIMILEKPLEMMEGRPVRQMPVPFLPNAYAVILAASVLLIGLFWDPLARASTDTGVNRFHPAPTVSQVERALRTPQGALP